MATDNPLVSYGWCKPSEVFLNILNGVPEPGAGPEVECVEHRWIRRTMSPSCGCWSCRHDTSQLLECDECCEWWEPYATDTDLTEWQKIWDSLE